MAKRKGLSPHVKGTGSQLLKIFDEAFHMGHRPADVFSAMLDDYLVTFYEGNGFDGKAVERIVRPGQRPEPIRPIVERAVARYRAEVAEEEPFVDLLGPVYMELAAQHRHSRMGQYFTPWPVAKLMASLTHQEDRTGRQGVADPACGSGVMLLAFIHTVIERSGPLALTDWSISGTDLDLTCAKMFAVQMVENILSHRIPVGELKVFQGDSLGPPTALKPLLHMSERQPALQEPRRSSAESAIAG